MDQLEDRKMMLFRFLCAFAWADFVIQTEEVEMIERLMISLNLSEENRQHVREWLVSPPRAEEVDPYLIPLDQQSVLLEAAQAIVLSDGELHPREAELLTSLKRIFAEMKSADAARPDEEH